MSDKNMKQYPNESLFPLPSWPSAEAKASSTNICQEDPQRDAVEERNGQISAEWQTSDELTGKARVLLTLASMWFLNSLAV